VRTDICLAHAVLPVCAMCVGMVACATDASPTPGYLQDTPTVVQERHPAGMTTRRESRHAPGQTPYRIELLGARSGRLVVGQVRLWRQADGRWTLESSNGERLTVREAGQGTPPILPRFVEGGVTWTVRVTGESVPVPRNGIATEAEPSLDLVLECVC